LFSVAAYFIALARKEHIMEFRPLANIELEILRRLLAAKHPAYSGLLDQLPQLMAGMALCGLSCLDLANDRPDCAVVITKQR
jgi:hypothetical protein